MSAEGAKVSGKGTSHTTSVKAECSKSAIGKVDPDSIAVVGSRDKNDDQADDSSKNAVERPKGAATPLDKDFLEAQSALGAQSCRGIGKPDLKVLGGDAHAEQVFRDMLNREKIVAGEWAVFYHSYNSSALIYEVQAAVAKVLFRFGAKHGVLPRLLKKPFEKLSCAEDVLKAFPTWPDRDHNPAFKSVGICCSTSLVSQDPEATPSQVFLNGYGASTVTIAVVETLLRECGTPSRHVNGLAQKVMNLAKEYGLPQVLGSGQQGHLLQILIHRSCVDHWAYASLPYGVLDRSRQPLSKSMATDGVICGQARLVVNPSAFMRARSVRLYACSADEKFHRNRPKFQDALFDALSPVLGSAEVRQSAAKGIYGGKLPSWWKDLETEKQQAAVAKSTDDAAKSAGKMINITASAVNSDVTTASQPRMKCRYGAKCTRKNENHLKEYAHPGDDGWSTDEIAEKTTLATATQACEAKAEDSSPPELAPVARRICCRHGASCYRNGLEHRRVFAHPGDSDWTGKVDNNASLDTSNDNTTS